MPTIEIDPVLARAMDADIDKFESMLERYLGGEMEEDAFRVFRLNNGIYGQRQGGTNQMVRVKIPWGGVTPEQLDMFGYLADTYSRGWGHLTTRQNVQFHFVELKRVPDLMREMASVGLTSREACGDTVRNVMGCHLAGACPFEAFDITPWAEAAYRHLIRHPFAQRLPRKFKINFSGCDTDCGQAMFNDVGVIATTRRTDDGEVEQGFRVFIAGGLGANPHPALALEEFTAKEDLLPDDRVGAPGVRTDRQPRQQAAGATQVGRRRAGLRGAPAPRLQDPRLPPRLVELAGRHPRGRQGVGRRARRARRRDPDRDRPGGRRHPRADPLHQAVRAVGAGQRRPRRRQGDRVGDRLRPPRRHHRRPVPVTGIDPARVRRRGPRHEPPEPRVPRPHRGAAADAVRAAGRPSAWPSPVPS